MSRYGDGGKLKKPQLIEKLSKTILEQLPVAPAASAGSAVESMISNYMSQVRAELRRQHPETRESWLKAEMDSMNHKTSHLGKPSVKDCCKYLNLGVRDDKEILVKNLVENLMSEIGHVVEAASASSGVAPAVVKRYVQILRVSLTQQEPHERSSWLQSQFKPLLHRRSKDGMPSVVDIAQFLKLLIAKPEGGWLPMPDLILNIIEKLIGDLPDSSSAAASAPVIGFVVALSIFWTFVVYIGMTYYMINVFCLSFCDLLLRPLVAVCMWMCVKGDGDDGSSEVSDYVEQLRLGLIQQAADQRISWLESQLKELLHKKSKNGKPSVVDVCRFLRLRIGDGKGGLDNKLMKANIIDKLIGDLPDSSAAASAPVMGFVVALFFVELLQFVY